MIYKRIEPSPALGDIVEGIWLQDSRDTAGNSSPSRVVPTGTVEIIFSYDGRIAHIDESGSVEMPCSYVTGQRSKSVLAFSTGHIGIVIVSLYPWGLSPLFRASVGAPDGYVDLKLLVDEHRISELEEKLYLASNSIQRVELIESFIIGQRSSKKFDDRIAVASQLLAQNGSDLSVRETARRLSVSKRHLSRKFISEIGIQPKLFSRIMRFQRALQIRRKSELSWSAIAMECGFTDQAHLIHEVKRFSGRSPGSINLQISKLNNTFNGDGVSKFFDTVYM